MKITKKFKIEMAHIVRNCSSKKCSHSIHGHSAVVEIEFCSNELDNAQMVIDFGLMTEIKKFVETMDHCYVLCSSENDSFKSFIKNECDRWICCDFNPSAEMLSMYIMSNVQRIINATMFNNGEDSGVKVNSVTYHETTTGKATCDSDDVERLYDSKGYSVIYSEELINELGSDVLSAISNVSSTKTIIKNKINKKIKLR